MAHASRSADQGNSAYNVPSFPKFSSYVPAAPYTITTFVRPNDYFGMPMKTVEYLRSPHTGEVILPPSGGRPRWGMDIGGVRKQPRAAAIPKGSVNVPYGRGVGGERSGGKTGGGFGYPSREIDFARYPVTSENNMYIPQSTLRVPQGQDVTVQDYRYRFGDSVIPKYKKLDIIDSFNYEIASKGPALYPHENIPIVYSSKRKPRVSARSSRRRRRRLPKHKRGGDQLPPNVSGGYMPPHMAIKGGDMFLTHHKPQYL